MVNTMVCLCLEGLSTKLSEGLEEDLNRSRAALQKLKSAERSIVSGMVCGCERIEQS